MATILVVDDQPAGRQFLVTLLGYQGHRLLEAIHGEEALEKVHSDKPDLIITDLVMPRMDGYEFAYRLRSDPTIARIPVIFYTAGYDVAEACELAQSCGVFHLLSKPSDPELILNYVESALQFQLPPLPSDGPGEIGWAQEVQTQHHHLLVNKLTQQVNLLEQEIIVRKQAEETICAQNAELEKRVLERTASLNRANSLLQSELGENQRARRLIETQAHQIQQHCDELIYQKAQLADANANLERLASTDGLTDLKNRRTFEISLEQEFVRTKRYGDAFSLVLLDVDKFKQYNDAFGHPAGDAALIQFATLLEKTVRLSDVVARYGGEEFAILLPNTDREGAMAMAERLRKTIEAAQWQHRPVTVSLGVASLTPRTCNPVQLVQEADQALYAAKHAGRNRARHYQDLESRGRILAVINAMDLYQAGDGEAAILLTSAHSATR